MGKTRPTNSFRQRPKLLAAGNFATDMKKILRASLFQRKHLVSVPSRRPT